MNHRGLSRLHGARQHFMAYGLMNEGRDRQSPLAGFALKPIKKLWGTGEVDLRTLASGHGRGRGGWCRSAVEDKNKELLGTSMLIKHNLKDARAYSGFTRQTRKPLREAHQKPKALRIGKRNESEMLKSSTGTGHWDKAWKDSHDTTKRHLQPFLTQTEQPARNAQAQEQKCSTNG